MRQQRFPRLTEVTLSGKPRSASRPCPAAVRPPLGNADLRWAAIYTWGLLESQIFQGVVIKRCPRPCARHTATAAPCRRPHGYVTRSEPGRLLGIDGKEQKPAPHGASLRCCDSLLPFPCQDTSTALPSGHWGLGSEVPGGAGRSIPQADGVSAKKANEAVRPCPSSIRAGSAAALWRSLAYSGTWHFPLSENFPGLASDSSPPTGQAPGPETRPLSTPIRVESRGAASADPRAAG